MSADTEKWVAWAKQHKVALGIGAAVLAMLAFSDSGEQPQPGPAGMDGSGPVTSGDTTPGFDKRQWDRDQRRDDVAQENRIDSIRGVERCMGDDGRVYEVEAGTCPNN